MDRTTPVSQNEEIELYIRTYYSLLRSSGSIRLRSLEETHAAMKSSIHYQAATSELDVSALTYCALRLPDCVTQTQLMVMGQMDEVFARAGYPVEEWQPVKAQARRRKFYYDDKTGTLAAFVASVSDIDDVIPCMVAFQIEWNKLHRKIAASNLGSQLRQLQEADNYMQMDLLEDIRQNARPIVGRFGATLPSVAGEAVGDQLGAGGRTALGHPGHRTRQRAERLSTQRPVLVAASGRRQSRHGADGSSRLLCQQQYPQPG